MVRKEDMLGHRQHRTTKAKPANPPLKVQKSAIPAKRRAEEESDDKDKPRVLLFSMDYGTSTLSLAYRIAVAGDRPNTANVRLLSFSDQDSFAPQQIAFAQDGTFYWGYVSLDRIASYCVYRC